MKDGGAGLHLGFKPKEDKREKSEGPKIRCPRCRWRPGRRDLWMCHCSHVWNTFDTHGKCPGCNFQWTDTMCLQCHQWSAHVDWYEPEKPAPQ